MNHVKTMPLSELLDSVSNLYFMPGTDEVSSVRDGWVKVADFFMNDKNERRVVETLLNVLRSGETFNSPVFLSLPDKYDLEEYPKLSDVAHILSNGTHRVVASMLYSSEVGNPDFPVSCTTEQVVANEDDFLYYDTVIEFDAGVFNNHKIEDLMNILHLSYPLANGDWFEVEVVSARENKSVTIFWSHPKDENFDVEQVHELVVEALIFNEVIAEASEVKIISSSYEV